ncbi:hypothetical protein GRF29_44g1296777 [Pseudopithomyces chartarum]|uniref:Uncharacterized protein n=1 Tax=Pseudopithomyces chartarum TaxID=1892770 RepID=A0AAN6M2R5_9PLEO|nr:hypothetical protein GRF29_44g1296777 [Pseudopithomyces chartarum]
MIATKKISWVHATPFELSQWIAHGSFYLSSATSLRYIFSSGEALRRIAGDLQVKINGIRVELKDIERSIIETAGGVIANAITVVKRDPDFLVAFVQLAQDFPEAQK